MRFEEEGGIEAVGRGYWVCFLGLARAFFYSKCLYCSCILLFWVWSEGFLGSGEWGVDELT
jgi:hypothetical protein